MRAIRESGPVQTPQGKPWQPDRIESVRCGSILAPYPDTRVTVSYVLGFGPTRVVSTDIKRSDQR